MTSDNPATTQSEVPEKARIKQASEPCSISFGVARKNHATLAITNRVRISANRHSCLVVMV